MSALRVGLIVPPLKGRIPPDMALMYPETEVLVEGVGVSSLTGEGYAEAEARVSEAAERLAARGAKALLLFGTSLSFYRGAAGNAALQANMAAVSGLPSMTLTTAMGRALRLLAVRRLAVATAYAAGVNSMFRQYFEAEGFVVPIIEGMDLTGLDAVEQTDEASIEALSRAVWSKVSGAEALVISCAGLTTAGAAARLEPALGRPVISSAMVGAWAAQGLAGGDTRVKGFGVLYEREDATWPSG